LTHAALGAVAGHGRDASRIVFRPMMFGTTMAQQHSKAEQWRTAPDTGMLRRCSTGSALLRVADTTGHGWPSMDKRQTELLIAVCRSQRGYYGPRHVLIDGRPRSRSQRSSYETTVAQHFHRAACDDGVDPLPWDCHRRSRPTPMRPTAGLPLFERPLTALRS